MPTKRNINLRKSRMQKWGGVASFVLAIAYIFSGLIYLMGNLRDTLGPLSYSLADLLYGPVWGASFVLVVLALQERIGKLAPRRMNLALLTALLTAAAFISVACIRAANRHYHLIHPELGLENNVVVLTTWTTLVAGLIGAGRHVLGWTLVLLGSAGWVSGQPQRAISVLYFFTGIAAMFVYVFPSLDEIVVLLGFVLSIWQGILLLRPASRS